MKTMLHFTKMSGAGNDFVMLDNRDGNVRLDAQTIARLCDRHRGIGGDGVLAVEPAQTGADFRMRYYNRDGSEAEMCGNGARCFARFAGRLAGMREKVSFETSAGVIRAELVGEKVRLTMSDPTDLTLHIEVPLKLENLTVHFVNTGVPHSVTAIADGVDLDSVAVERLGNAIRFHERFAPKGTNVNFIQPTGNRAIAIRTYERGVEAETLACGTGVVASAIVHHELTGAKPPITVRVRGGDVLEVGFEKTAGGYRNVTLTGPATFVFEGTIEI
jgi:diaminopimelate epimerase